MIEGVTDVRESRRNFLISMGAVGALLSGCASRVPPVQAQSGVDSRVEQIIADTISVDMHNHVAQLSFTKTAAGAKPDPGRDLAGEMSKSGFTAVCLTHVINYYRTPQIGDWYQYHLQLLAYTDRLLAASGMRRALTVSDLRAAHRARVPVIIQASEGAQFIEGRIDRVAEAYGRGLRHLQLLHQMDDIVAPLGGVQQSTQTAAANTAVLTAILAAALCTELLARLPKQRDLLVATQGVVDQALYGS